MYTLICRPTLNFVCSLNIMCGARTLALMAAGAFGAAPVAAQPNVPGYVVEQFGTLPAGYKSYTMSRDAAGWLYFGSDDNNGAGVQLMRMGPGGGAAVPFGLTTVYDPDGVIIDASGQISGSPGALLVMSSSFAGGEGVLRKVLQTGEVSAVVSATSVLNNGDAMAFDSLNRLYVNVSPNQTIVRCTGAVPAVFISTPANVGTGILAIDDQDRLMVACSDGAVRRYTTAGALDATISVGTGATSVAWAGSPPWGPAAYGMDSPNGVLKRIDTGGATQTIGTNFGVVYAIVFSPDGNLYAANYDTGIVYRVKCPPSASVTDSTQSMCQHGTAQIAVSATGGVPFTYQWRKGGDLIDVVGNPSAATATLVLSNVTLADEADYDCIVSNVCGEVISDAVTFRICIADFNCDAQLDFFDYLDFVAAFSNSSASADFNEDGVVDFFDYLDFVQAFSTGC